MMQQMQELNEFGRMALDHWKVARPISLARIPEDEQLEFFRQLGEEAAEQVESLWMTYAGDDPEGESARQKEGRLNMARLMARERVLAEMILLPEDPAMFADDEPTWADVEQDSEEELDTFEEWRMDQDQAEDEPTDPAEWRDWHDRRQDP